MVQFGRVFSSASFLKRVSQPPALIGMLASIASMLYVFFMTKIAWTCTISGKHDTLVVAWLASFAFYSGSG